jgi:hypothetical protein
MYRVENALSQSVFIGVHRWCTAFSGQRDEWPQEAQNARRGMAAIKGDR